MASARTHRLRAERHDRAAAHWDEVGDHEQAEIERRNAEAERERAKPIDSEPVEIPIPTRDALLRDLSAGARHDDETVDEMERESFPASDPPSKWAGP